MGGRDLRASVFNVSFDPPPKHSPSTTAAPWCDMACPGCPPPPHNLTPSPPPPRTPAAP